MKVILDGQVKSFFYRLIIVEPESGFVDFHQAVYLGRRNNLKIEGIPFLLHFFRRATAEKQRIGRYVKEVLAVVVYDVQTVICIACQRIGCGNTYPGLVIITAGNFGSANIPGWCHWCIRHIAGQRIFNAMVKAFRTQFRAVADTCLDF